MGQVEILKAAIRSGINFIDNAEVYGAFPGESESIMGRAANSIPINTEISTVAAWSAGFLIAN